MANFATVADVENFLQVEVPAEKVDSVERALTEATAAIRNYCRQHLSRVVGDTVKLDAPNGPKLFLPELPVVEVTAVVLGDETLMDEDDYWLSQGGILHRLDGRRWDLTGNYVEVTYTHGYDPIPDDIVAVATRAASRVYQAGLRAEDSGAILGIASKSLGDFSVSFTPETAGGGVGEGVMGASAARMLLLSEKDILNRYRLKE